MSAWRYTLQEKVLDFRGVLENPKLDPEKTVVVFAVLIIGALLAFAIAMAIFARVSRKLGKPDGKKPAARPVKKERPRALLTPAERRFSALAVWLVVCGALFYGTTYTAKPAFCGSCHTMQPALAGWKTSIHKNVTCNACHARPGLTGYLSRQIDFASEALEQTRGGKVLPEATVANSSCLRCHSKVLSGTLKIKTLKVRHSDFLREGAACVDCHTSHKETRKASMSKCITCHNGTIASGKCSTCHIGDFAARANAKREFVKINLPPIRKCSGCHAVNRCTTHHGSEMPHQTDWLEAHGKIAASSNEPVCWRCHEQKDYGFCRNCHNAIPPHDLQGKPGWVAQHQFVVKGSAPDGLRSCNVCHKVDFCSGCHDEDGQRVFDLIRT